VVPLSKLPLVIKFVGVGVVCVLNACEPVAAAVLALPEPSLNVLAATLTLIVPVALAVGETTKVALLPSLAMVKVPLVPPVTVTSLVANPDTASLNVKVKVTSPVAVALTLSVMVTVGAVVSVVVPPPPQAESKADAAMAQAESWIGNDRMKVSLGL
jgi:hypothetical protein